MNKKIKQELSLKKQDTTETSLKKNDYSLFYLYGKYILRSLEEMRKIRVSSMLNEFAADDEEMKVINSS